MHLVFQVYYLLFGSILFFARIFKDKSEQKKLDIDMSNYRSQEELFIKTVCVNVHSEKWLPDMVDYERKAEKEYEDMIRYLREEGLDERYLFWVEWEINKNKLKPRVYMANRGVLGNDIITLGKVISNDIELCQETRVAMFKWFDKAINNIYPQYFVVQCKDSQSENFTDFKWNALVPSWEIKGRRISDITMDEINHIRW